MNHKAFIKDLFYRAGLAKLLDSILYKVSRYRHRKKNTAFRNANPSLAIPSDYFLYETYRLDYEQFFKDGEDTAKEVMGWTGKYFRQEPPRILDWGCGVSRVAPFIEKMTTPGTTVFACDVNSEMIAFGRRHYKTIHYDVAPYAPPTSYEDNYFHLVYAFSVFTHIEAGLQIAWLKEIHRILDQEGVFLFTTHGRLFQDRLLPAEQRYYQQNGAFTKTYGQAGHRMMTTYNAEETFRKMLHPWFEVLEYHDGAVDLTKAGGQDLWIVRKLPIFR
ncbi:MAG TPA: class I SAM-dependent methyltransferase [Puia sp.]|nr:class I SAM-dependent methyltransferase [Puia sp.]